MKHFLFLRLLLWKLSEAVKTHYSFGVGIFSSFFFFLFFSFPLQSRLVNQSQRRSGASPVSLQCTVTKPNRVQNPKMSNNGKTPRSEPASMPTARCTKAVEIKKPGISRVIFPEESKLEGWMEVRTRGGVGGGKMCPGYGKQDNWIYIFQS